MINVIENYLFVVIDVVEEELDGLGVCLLAHLSRTPLAWAGIEEVDYMVCNSERITTTLHSELTTM